ncbi:MAG: hypothetical protein HY525_16115 [Betaproteobacteria bacterium]|nr:hypothetical protein [Betaproteobacteria bacterium]
MDRALWISWYNLPGDGRDAYLAWLHGSYLPRILKQPGVLWAAHYASAKIAPHPRIRFTDDKSVPGGTDYILLLGAGNSHPFAKDVRVFVELVPRQPDTDLSDDDRNMLAMRRGERVNIMVEEARVDGPEAAQRAAGTAPGPCIQLGSFNANSFEAELLAWYARWRMPALSKLPGCIGMRKLVSVSGWAKHGVLYEFLSLEARGEHLPTLSKLYPEMEAWTDRFIPKLIHEPGSPNVARRIWPPVKS